MVAYFLSDTRMRLLLIFLSGILLLIMTSCNTPALAQFSLGARLSPAIPLGEFSESANFGAGLHLDASYWLTSRISLGLSAGFSRFRSDFNEVTFGVDPITARFAYFLTSGDRLKAFVGMDAGIYIYSIRIRGIHVNSSYAGFSPVAGFLYPLSERLAFEGSLQYSHIFSSDDYVTYLPLNLGLRFDFGR